MGHYKMDHSQEANLVTNIRQDVLLYRTEEHIKGKRSAAYKIALEEACRSAATPAPLQRRTLSVGR